VDGHVRGVVGQPICGHSSKICGRRS
jgi:hypothetical protein